MQKVLAVLIYDQVLADLKSDSDMDTGQAADVRSAGCRICFGLILKE